MYKVIKKGTGPDNCHDLGSWDTTKERKWTEKKESPWREEERIQWQISVCLTVFLNRLDYILVTSGSVNQMGDLRYLSPAGIVVLPMKLDPRDCHLAIWNKSLEGWYYANCEHPDSCTVPNLHLLTEGPMLLTWKPTSEDLHKSLAFCNQCCPREKKGVYEFCAKGKLGFKPLH